MLLDLHGRVSDILNAHMIGMYLVGSLAMDGFEASRSDIDFVVIAEDHLSDPIIESLESMHMRLARMGNKWMKKLEGAYVPKAIIRRHDPDHPPVPTINEGSFYVAPLGSDWVFQRYLLREARTTVSGPSLYDLIDPVFATDLKDAVHEVIEQWWAPMLDSPSRLLDPGYQPYAVLSMCRSLYTVTTGELASKSKAANWALESLPDDWSSLINHALAWRDGDDIVSIERTKAFMQVVISTTARFR